MPIAHPAPTLPYSLLDVFTDQPFSGNQLAVFVDPGPLSDGQMQRIAAELRLSETVFIWSPPIVGRPWPTRIFTPGVELPFAGHPTVGAALLLAHLGRVTGTGDTIELELDLAVGTVPVTVSVDDLGVPVAASLTVPRTPERVGTVDSDELAAVVGLDPADLHPELPVRGYSAGNPFSIIPVVDPGTLGRAQVDSARWKASVAASAAPHLYLVTPLTDAGAALPRWRARMFAPAMGIAEDPATGAAAAAFAGYLAEINPAVLDQSAVIEQGVEMGRASTIRLTITGPRGGRSSVVRVGGPAVVIGTGVLVVPPSPQPVGGETPPR